MNFSILGEKDVFEEFLSFRLAVWITHVGSKFRHGLSNGSNRLQLRTFVAFLGPFPRGLASQNDDNRGQSWTIFGQVP